VRRGSRVGVSPRLMVRKGEEGKEEEKEGEKRIADVEGDMKLMVEDDNEEVEEEEEDDEEDDDEEEDDEEEDDDEEDEEDEEEVEGDMTAPRSTS